MDKKPSPRKSVLSYTLDFILKEGLTLITGGALGATITLALSYEDAMSFWGIVGSLLSGLGTVGLLAFGWFKADEWMKQITTEKKLNIKADIVCSFKESAMKASTILKEEGSVISEKMRNKHTKNNELILMEMSKQDQVEINSLAEKVMGVIGEIYIKAGGLNSISINSDNTLLAYKDSVKYILHELFDLSRPITYEEYVKLDNYYHSNILKMYEVASDIEKDLLGKILSLKL
ncbi:hypothetical protein KDW99_16280 [Marinomonas rhizomae]|uniref:hypothetical protein n=1 Tax=Marinomonas rhizomae TaxID=491948 RepID=UPI002106256B|nr:hypothetical protein [Marinomonas rhizomae]UTV98795.1 hypothetical protein KDW99_16280 [Marinomonas rhizomae]